MNWYKLIDVGKQKPIPQTVDKKLKTGHNGSSIVFHRVKESGSSEPRTRFENDTGSIKELLRKLMPLHVSEVTLLTVF